MEVRTPKATEFQAQNEPRVVSMTNIETGADQDVTCTYGLVVFNEDTDKNKSGDIKSHLFVLSTVVEIMGKEQTFVGQGADVAKAFTSLLNGLNATEDEFELFYDDSDEFFSQKYVTKKADPNDVWSNPKFADAREELSKARADAEEAFALAAEGEANAQAEALEAAKLLVHVKDDLLGGSMSAMKVWAAGDGKDGGNESFRFLSQLGNGANALGEAMRLAQISRLEYMALPSSLTSGKGVDTHGRNSIKQVVSDADVMKVMSDVDTKADTADIDGIEVLLRQVARGAYGIADALEMDDGAFVVGLPEIASRVDEVIAKHIEEFSEKYGKSVNTYDKTQRVFALQAYGGARLCSEGGGIFGKAVNAVEAYHETPDDDADTRRKIIDNMFAKTAGNALVKEAYATLKSHKEAVAAEKKRSKAAKAVSDDVDVKSPSWAELDALAAAAYLYSRVQKHSKPDQVAAELRALLSQAPALAAE